VTLLSRIERHLRRSGQYPTTFGRQAAGDPRLVADMRSGRNVGPALARRIEAYLEDRRAAK
jgi:hypothetical protein